MLAGLPEHREILEEYQLVLLQLREAVAAQKDPQLIAALDEKLYAVYAELALVTQGVSLLCVAARLHDRPFSQDAQCFVSTRY